MIIEKYSFVDEVGENNIIANIFLLQTAINETDSYSYCPPNYSLCTTDASDIFEYVSKTAIDNQKKMYTANDISYGTFDNIVLHIQGDYINPPYSLSSNITSSSHFNVHRLYLTQHILYKARHIYPILSNTNEFFDVGPISNIKTNCQLNSSHFFSWQYTKSKQLENTALIHKHVDLYFASKWYSDNDNYLDIITTNYALVGKSGDVWSYGDEQFVSLERCGYGIFETASDHYGFTLTEINKWQIVNHTKVVNVAQSKGYYHWIVEVLPRIAVLLDELRSDSEWIIHVSEPNRIYVQSFLDLLNLNSTVRLNVEAPSFAKQMITPQMSPCLYARRVPTLLLSNYLRDAIHKNMNETEIENDAKFVHILLIKRGEKSRRFIANFDGVISNISNAFLSKNKIVVDVFDASGGPHSVSVFQYGKQFYSANIVIGAFGAGLTNIVFSKPNTTVIVINSIHKNRFGKSSRMYAHHATALGCKFYAYTCTDWTVNATDLLQVIHMYLQSYLINHDQS